MILFECTLKGRTRILKNSKKIIKVGKRRIPVHSDQYKRWAIFAAIFITKAKTNKTPIDKPVNLKCLFYLKNHQHEADLSNMYQGIEDILEECGVLENDKLIHSHDGSRKIFDPNEEERVEITLSLLKD